MFRLGLEQSRQEIRLVRNIVIREDQVAIIVNVLERAEQWALVPLVAGDCSALATLGWADASIGARCEVRVSRAALDRALGVFGMEQAT